MPQPEGADWEGLAKGLSKDVTLQKWWRWHDAYGNEDARWANVVDNALVTMKPVKHACLSRMPHCFRRDQRREETSTTGSGRAARAQRR
jgi:hypothetical protein